MTTQPGYQEGSEPMWWWKVAQHLDLAQAALANAMAHNLEDQTLVFALQDKLVEGQKILLEIFRGKGLLSAVSNGLQGDEHAMPSPSNEPGAASDAAVMPVIENSDPSTAQAHET
jgi:hypothetical protein